MKVVLYVMNLALSALAVEPACPVCSRYHYEEMVLERVLRNELALEQTLKDIMGTNTKVAEALGKLQDENDKVNKAIESMERTQSILEATVNDALKTSVTNVSDSLSHIHDVSGRAIKDMEGRVERIKGELQTPTIQFRAQLASSITVSSGQDVVFARVQVSDVQGYDKGTGKFTAPVAGLYNFDVHYCSQSSQYVQIEIVHNGKSVQSSTYNGGSAYEGSSMQVYVRMSKADIVWVRSFSPSYFYQHDGYCDSTFSGVLIRA